MVTSKFCCNSGVMAGVIDNYSNTKIDNWILLDTSYSICQTVTFMVLLTVKFMRMGKNNQKSDIPAGKAEILLVISLKENIIKKYDSFLEVPGKVNLRRLLRTPVFTISQLSKRVEEYTPELITLFYKELDLILNK